MLNASRFSPYLRLITAFATLGFIISGCRGTAQQVASTATSPVPGITPSPTLPPATVTPTEVIPTATAEPAVPPVIATPASSDLTSVGVSSAEFETMRLLFEDWWLFWTELGAVSIVDMPSAIPEAEVSVSAVYRIFVDRITGENLIGVEVLAGDYAGQILTFPLGRENGDTIGRPEAEAIANDPVARADWYPLFLSGPGIGRYAGYWVRLENNEVTAYVDPVTESWVDGEIPVSAEALWRNIGVIPETVEEIAELPLIPNPIENPQEDYERVMSEYLRRVGERVDWDSPGVWNYGSRGDDFDLVPSDDGRPEILLNNWDITRLPVATARINFRGRDGLVMTFAALTGGENPQRLLLSFVTDPLDSLAPLNSAVATEVTLSVLNSGDWDLISFFQTTDINYNIDIFGWTTTDFRDGLLEAYEVFGYNNDVRGAVWFGLETDVGKILWPLSRLWNSSD